MIVVSRLTLLILAGWVVLQLGHAPFATNDGPVHLAFAKIIATHGADTTPLQSEAYLVDLRPSPNLIGYFILVPLMKVVSPQAAEAVLQAMCILGPVFAGWLAIRMLDAGHEFLAVALLPFSLNQMFFLGLYNYSLSIAAFFIAVALYLRLDAAPSVRRAAALAAGLVLAFFCHAAGFVMAVVGIGSMACAKVALRVARGQSLGMALWAQRHVVASLLVPLPVGLLFMSATSGAPVAFGADVISRIDQFIHLTPLDVSSDVTRYVARGLRTALALGALWSLVCLLTWRSRGIAPERLEQGLAIVAAGLMAALVMLFFPDTLGGGWTHFRRMLIFPYFWVVLLLAWTPIPRAAGAVALALAAVASAGALASAVDVQRNVERQLALMAEVDRRVGAHCSVAPVILESHPLDASGMPMDIRFEPFFQAASRLELNRDRVVLFNFLARLDVYPVRFKPAFEPQGKLFGWKPYEHDVRTKRIDIDAYERASGIPVDYVLVWGWTTDLERPIRWQIKEELDRSALVYQSSDGWVALYRRPGAKGGRCEAPDGHSPSPSLPLREGPLHATPALSR